MIRNVINALAFLALAYLVGIQVDETGYNLFFDFHGLMIVIAGCLLAAGLNLGMFVIEVYNENYP